MAIEGDRYASAFGPIPTNVPSVDAGGNLRIIYDEITFDESTIANVTEFPFGGLRIPSESRVDSIVVRGDPAMPGNAGSVYTQQDGSSHLVSAVSGLNGTSGVRIDYAAGFDLSNKLGGTLFLVLANGSTFATPATIVIKVTYAIE